VRDWALISHNAQVYNRPSAEVYQDAIALRELVKLELAKLVEKNIMSAEEAQYPDLGEIPDVEDSPPPDPDEEDAEEDEDDEEEDEEDKDTDEERPKRGRVGRKLGRPTLKGESSKVDDSKDDPESRKVRGRPPKVLTPMEARINTLLKGLRKFKHQTGELKILPFEKLPDKSQMPEYYQEIKDPIAMDLIKRKAKRKKYQSVDSALRDIDLMFDNAKAYNLDNSQVYKDAVDLQQEAHLLADQEKQKPDSDFVDEDGRLPLLEMVKSGRLATGSTYKTLTT
jgi:chromatin structure-remodeling complex subunit RSC1/2